MIYLKPFKNIIAKLSHLNTCKILMKRRKIAYKPTNVSRFLHNMEYISLYNSPLGEMTLASDEKNLTGLWFNGQKYDKDVLDKEVCEKPLPIFDETKKWLDIYFSGECPNFTPPIHIKSTGFRKEVAEIMLTIPYGKTMTYGEIANKISKQRNIEKMSAQAVGGAVGHNSISIIIPCHRVVGSNGKLTGYAGGLNRKIKLLSLEKSNLFQQIIKNDK